MNTRTFKFLFAALIVVLGVIALFRNPAGLAIIGFGILISDNWADALDPIVRQRFLLGLSRRATLRERIFNVQTSTRAYEQMSGVGALGVEAWDKYRLSGTVGEADFDQGYKSTFTHQTYPLEVKIRRELLDDNQWTEVFNIPDRMGDSATVKRETDAASVFGNAFSASFTGADGVALCSNAHPQSPSKTGSTQDNNDTLPLTRDNVRTVRERMMAFTDDNGNKQGVTPNMLLVPPALEDDALIIARSMLDPTSAENAINPQAGRWTVQVWHYLPDPNAWFMIDDALRAQALEWWDRSPVGINPKVEDKTLVSTWIAYMRYSYGWADWRWVYGNNPS